MSSEDKNRELDEASEETDGVAAPPDSTSSLSIKPNLSSGKGNKRGRRRAAASSRKRKPVRPPKTIKGASHPQTHVIPVSLAAMLVTIGVVYGDIGTSPMYVTKALLAGNGGIMSVTEEFVLGALSLVIWTVTLLTTVKYVLISLKADNYGEGGIFALYSIVRRYGKWLIIPAMLGGSALLADGVLTPAVTITTGVEGLRTIPETHAIIGDNQMNVVVITLIIVCILFVVQRAGTSKIGRAFGPVMLGWFLFLGITGLLFTFTNPKILLAINPVYGLQFLFSPNNHAGIMILGSCFLATTGAEALYSDMGHVGKGNIYATWPFVKACLILSYLGQGAWLLANAGNPELAAIEDLNPFFQMLPGVVRPFGVVFSVLAAIIASQALITGAFSLVSEASRLDLMPHLQVFYPSETKGQLYIPLVNKVMWAGCIIVVLLFQSSAHMEAAYGLAITITMLCTTVLLFIYLHRVRKVKFFPFIFLAFFVMLEGFFFGSSLTKFFHGGYFTILLAAHPYVSHDPFVGGVVEDALREQGACVLFADEADKARSLKKSYEFSHSIPWIVNRELIGATLLLHEHIDGIVLISAFPCGPDSMTDDAIMRCIQGTPILNLMIDAQSGTAGVETRVESFVDILRFQQKGGYVHE